MPGSAHSAGSFDFLLQAMNKSLTSPHSAPIQKDAAVRTAEEAFTSKSSRSSIVVIIIVQGDREQEMLPKGWQQRHSSSHNRPYYFNELTGVTQWDLPTTSTTEDNSTPSQSHSRGNKVHAYHLLVKHAQSRRPSSWREAVITISETEALEQIRRIRSEIFAASSGDIFTEFKGRAQERSDCSSAKKGGDLGFFGPESFEDAAFALKVGELSGPVKSDSGVHLIYRVA